METPAGTSSVTVQRGPHSVAVPALRSSAWMTASTSTVRPLAAPGIAPGAAAAPKPDDPTPSRIPLFDAGASQAASAVRLPTSDHADYLEVLYAQNDLFAVELASVRTQVEAYTQIVNVYGAMGGGWVDEAAQRAPQPQGSASGAVSR